MAGCLEGGREEESGVAFPLPLLWEEEATTLAKEEFNNTSRENIRSDTRRLYENAAIL